MQEVVLKFAELSVRLEKVRAEMDETIAVIKRVLDKDSE